MTNSDSPGRDPSVADVVFALASTTSLLALSVYLFGSDSSSGASQIALVIGAITAVFIGIKNGYSWKIIEESITKGIAVALPAILILFSVGSLIGTWMLSGTVPTMIYYGLMLLDPAVFYPATCVICAITAVSIGSSWTVAGTLGIGLIAVAATLGLSVEITAGAIISGAYFGDKMSPLSDSTNLAPAVTGVELFTHIRHMVWTTAPSITIAVTIFAFISWLSPAAPGEASLAENMVVLDQAFDINLVLLLPVVLVVYLSVKKVPAVAAILSGAILGSVLAVIYQPVVVRALAGGDAAGLGNLELMLKGVWIAWFDGYVAATGSATLDNLLSRGGMSSMLHTVWLITVAMAFGSAMERAGILKRLADWLLSVGNSAGALIASTATTCLGMNILAGDQYISIVLPGRMFKAEFERRGLDAKNLSRVLEDTGTITSPLVPWNTCGAYMAATLGVPTLMYLPYCFFNLVNPIVTIVYGFTNFKITPLDSAENLARAKRDGAISQTG